MSQLQRSDLQTTFNGQVSEIDKGIVKILPAIATFGGDIPCTVVFFQKYTDQKKVYKSNGIYISKEIVEESRLVDLGDGTAKMEIIKSRKDWRPKRDVVGAVDMDRNFKMAINFTADENKALPKVLGMALTLLEKRLTLQNIAGQPQLKGGKPVHVALKFGKTVIATTACADARAILPSFSKKDNRYDRAKFSRFCSLVNSLLNEAINGDKKLQIDSDIAAALGLSNR